MDQLRHRIVVGLDRSAQDDVVLAAALRQAASMGAAVRVIHALGVLAGTPGQRFQPASRAEANAQHARAGALREELRQQLAETVAQFNPPVDVEYEVVRGDPATALLAASRDADLLVIGTRSTGNGSPMMLGAVSQDVAVHANCAVLLVPRSPSLAPVG